MYEVLNRRMPRNGHSSSGLRAEAAAYFFTGIAGGLRCKIIRHFMNDYAFPHNLGNIDTLIVKTGPCVSVVSKERNQIPIVQGMFGVSRIIMRSGV